MDWRERRDQREMQAQEQAQEQEEQRAMQAQASTQKKRSKEGWQWEREGRWQRKRPTPAPEKLTRAMKQPPSPLAAARLRHDWQAKGSLPLSSLSQSPLQRASLGWAHATTRKKREAR